MVLPVQAYSAFSFLGFVLVSIPFPWHFRAESMGTCIYMAWAALSCLNSFINSVVWADNVINWAPIWCDLSVRIIVGSGIGLQAASLCIHRRLFDLINRRTTISTRGQIQRARTSDIIIGVGIPMIVMALQYFLRGHRFDIFEEIGCQPTTLGVWPITPLLMIFPVVIGLISMSIYMRIVYHFFWHYDRFKQLLPELKCIHYLRLICLVGTDALYTTFILVYTLETLLPDFGGANLPQRFFLVSQYHSNFWRMNKSLVTVVEMTRWNPVIRAFVFFGFFGICSEAFKHYRLAYNFLVKCLNYSTVTMRTEVMSLTRLESLQFEQPASNNQTISDFGSSRHYRSTAVPSSSSSYASSSTTITELPTISRPSPAFDVTILCRPSTRSLPVSRRSPSHYRTSSEDNPPCFPNSPEAHRFRHPGQSANLLSQVPIQVSTRVESEDTSTCNLLAPVPWRHPDELEYIRPSHWPDVQIISFLTENAFSIPKLESSQTVVITRVDGLTTTLPSRYRVPLMFVAHFQWTSLRLILTEPTMDEDWSKYKFDLLHIARLCVELLEQAGNARAQIESTAGWRCSTFDRVLTRFSENCFCNREEDVEDFFLQYGEIKYEKDIFEEIDWNAWVLKGASGFVLLQEQVVNGITAHEYTEGLSTSDSINSRLARRIPRSSYV